MIARCSRPCKSGVGYTVILFVPQSKQSNHESGPTIHPSDHPSHFTTMENWAELMCPWWLCQFFKHHNNPTSISYRCTLCTPCSYSILEHEEWYSIILVWADWFSLILANFQPSCCYGLGCTLGVCCCRGEIIWIIIAWPNAVERDRSFEPS